jgi:hypothetical protein
MDYAIGSTGPGPSGYGPIQSVRFEHASGIRSGFGYRFRGGWEVAWNSTYFHTGGTHHTLSSVKHACRIRRFRGLGSLGFCSLANRDRGSGPCVFSREFHGGTPAGARFPPPTPRRAPGPQTGSYYLASPHTARLRAAHGSPPPPCELFWRQFALWMSQMGVETRNKGERGATIHRQEEAE